LLLLPAADALALADERAAVVWFDREPDTLLVVIAVPRAGRVLIRRVEGEGSATLESAALIVRGALRALAAGAVIGVERAEVAPRVRATSLTMVEIHGRGSAPRRPPPAWLASLGWAAAYDAQSPVAQGLAGRFGIALERLEVGAAAMVGLPADIEDPRARLTLSRRHLAAFAGLRAHAGTRLHLVLGAAAGVVWFARSTVSHGLEVEPAPPKTTTTLLAGPEALLRWLPWGGALGLSLQLAGDFVPGAPEIGYRVEGRFRPVHRLATPVDQTEAVRTYRDRLRSRG